MANTAQEIYAQVVRTLPLTERLRLANLILNDLVEQNIAVVEQSDIWTEQDRIDLTNFSMQYAATVFPADEEFFE
jgi:D-serine deaminase-like pyridoxal phosphate-dependent protein